MRHPIVSFNAGELSPQIDARSDVDKYAAGCRILENMIPRIYGSAERRPGTKFIQETSGIVRLLEFEKSNTVAYVVEASNLQFRFYTNGGLLLDGSGNPVTVTTPYLAADLFTLQTKQSNDVMWITHPDYAPRKLTRTSATAFALDEIVFTTGPFLPRNDLENDDGVTITPSVTTGSGTLTASSATFESGHVGALFKLTQPRVAVIESGNGNGVGTIGSAINVEGPFTFNTHGTWTGTIDLERNEDSNGWETFRSFPGQNDRNVQFSDNESALNVQYRMRVTAWTVTTPPGTINADITVDTPTQDGIARITSFSSDTSVGMTILSDFASTDATKRWHEGAWSAVRGYPTTVTFFEERTVYAGTAFQPQTTWFSATGDFENFKTPITLIASSSFSLTASSDKRNAIRWISALESLVFGTVGGEWQIRSSALDQPITPTNFSMKQQTSYGVNTLQALQVGDVLLFVDFVNRKVREITWSDDQRKYVAPDLSALAEHITATGIVSMAYQRNPDSIVWMTLTNGTLISMTYQRDQDVIAWAKHPMTASGSGGTAEIAATPASEGTYSFTWVSENATIYGVPVGDKKMKVTLINGTSASDVGGGIVNIPFAGNPFESGQVVRLTGTTSYGGEHILTSGTDAGNLQFADAFNAETFTGVEIAMRVIGSLPSGAGRMAQDSEGNLYYAYDFSVSRASYITKIEPDGTETDDFLTGGAWPIDGDNASICLDVSITPDDAFIYLTIQVNAASDRHHVEKYNLQTGELVWTTFAGFFGGFAADLDADGNYYVAGVAGGTFGTNALAKFASADGFKTDFADPGANSNYVVVVNDNLGVVAMSRSTTLNVRTLNDSSGAALSFVGIIASDNLIFIDDIIFIREGTNLHKIRIDFTGGTITGLTTITTVAGPADAIGIYADPFGNIVVINQDFVVGKSDVWHFYDTDLNFLSKIDGMYSLMLRTWDASAGGAWIQGNAFPNGTQDVAAVAATPAIPAGEDVLAVANSVAVIPGATEDEVWISVSRTVNGLTKFFVEQMQPRDWGSDDEDAWFVDSGLKYDMDTPVTILSGLEHLEGEEVAVYGNGALFPRQTVVGGEITISEPVTKAIVGLAFRYKLKPMRADVNRPDGGSKGSIKKVTEVVFSFLKAGNVQYGTDVDDLRNIDFRTTEDYDTPPAFFTGDKVETFDGGFDAEDNVLVTGDDPLPCTIRALVLRGKVTGR